MIDNTRVVGSNACKNDERFVLLKIVDLKVVFVRPKEFDNP